MVTTDDRGFVKYWQSNFNNVHTFQAHNEPIRCSRWDSVAHCMFTFCCSKSQLLQNKGLNTNNIDLKRKIIFTCISMIQSVHICHCKANAKRSLFV